MPFSDCAMNDFSHRKKQDKHQTVPIYRPTTSFQKNTKTKQKKQNENSQTHQGRAILSSHSAFFFFLHSTLCTVPITRWLLRQREQKQLKPPARVGDSPPVSPTHYGCLILHKVTVDGGAAGSRRRKQERTASSWPQSILGPFFFSLPGAMAPENRSFVQGTIKRPAFKVRQ